MAGMLLLDAASLPHIVSQFSSALLLFIEPKGQYMKIFSCIV
jgi:hypothetical protein